MESSPSSHSLKEVLNIISSCLSTYIYSNFRCPIRLWVCLLCVHSYVSLSYLSRIVEEMCGGKWVGFVLTKISSFSIWTNRSLTAFSHTSPNLVSYRIYNLDIWPMPTFLSRECEQCETHSSYWHPLYDKHLTGLPSVVLFALFFWILVLAFVNTLMSVTRSARYNK